MSEQDQHQPSPAEYQQATAGQQVPYEQAAAQAVGQVIAPDAAGEDADAGNVVEQIRQQVTRDVLLPMETKINEMMASAQSQQDALRKQIEQLQAQLKATQAQVGPPAATLYADSLAGRVRSLQAANPALDLKPVIAHADQLAAVTKDVVEGTADPSKISEVAARVERWFTRVHPHVEGAGTVVAELGHLADETAKLADAA